MRPRNGSWGPMTTASWMRHPRAQGVGFLASLQGTKKQRPKQGQPGVEEKWGGRRGWTGTGEPSRGPRERSPGAAGMHTLPVGRVQPERVSSALHVWWGVRDASSPESCVPSPCCRAQAASRSREGPLPGNEELLP